MYHGVVDRVRDPELDRWSITADELRAHLAALTTRWEVVPLQRVVDALRAGRTLDPRWVVLTFDDAYRGLFDHGVPVLREFRVPWTVFVPVGLIGTGRTEPGIWSALCYLGSRRAQITVTVDGERTAQRLGSRDERLALWLAASQTPGMPEAVVAAFGDEANALLAEYAPLQLVSWEALAELAGEGVEVGAHGWEHRRLLPGVPHARLSEEIVRPRQELLRRGFECRYFCAAYGCFPPAGRELARATGYHAVVLADAGRVTPATDPFALPRVRADLPWRELSQALGSLPERARGTPRFPGERLPPEYHMTEFTPADLEDVAQLFKDLFPSDIPVERVRGGLAYRYVENPFTGHPGTAPLVVRHGGPEGPLIGFFGCLPTPVLFRGQEKVSGYPGDFFIRKDFQTRRLGIILLRALLARTADVIFTSSAGPPTQPLLRHYDCMPITPFQRLWTLPVERVPGRLRRVPGWLEGGEISLMLTPLQSITDAMVAQAAAHTAGASFTVRRTRAYLEWRFAPAVRAAAPEGELLEVCDRGQSVGWIVVRRQERTLEMQERVLEVLDWFVPPDRYAETLRLVCEHAHLGQCVAVVGRGLQAALRATALALGGVESRGMELYWTWFSDKSVYDGMDWDQAYLSPTDGDLTLPWNLGPTLR